MFWFTTGSLTPKYWCITLCVYIQYRAMNWYFVHWERHCSNRHTSQRRLEQKELHRIWLYSLPLRMELAVLATYQNWGEPCLKTIFLHHSPPSTCSHLYHCPSLLWYLFSSLGTAAAHLLWDLATIKENWVYRCWAVFSAVFADQRHINNL